MVFDVVGWYTSQAEVTHPFSRLLQGGPTSAPGTPWNCSRPSNSSSVCQWSTACTCTRWPGSCDEQQSTEQCRQSTVTSFALWPARACAAKAVACAHPSNELQHVHCANECIQRLATTHLNNADRKPDL